MRDYYTETKAGVPWQLRRGATFTSGSSFPQFRTYPNCGRSKGWGLWRALFVDVILPEQLRLFFSLGRRDEAQFTFKGNNISARGELPQKVAGSLMEFVVEVV